MSELIAIQTNDNMKQVISARELHDKLGIKERFSLWFERIQKSLNIKEEIVIFYCAFIISYSVPHVKTFGTNF